MENDRRGSDRRGRPSRIQESQGESREAGRVGGCGVEDRTQSHQLFRGPRSTLPDKVAKVVPGSKRNLDIIPSATWSP